MLQKINMTDCKPMNVLLVKGFKLVVETSIDLVGENHYCQMVRICYIIVLLDLTFNLKLT